ncbi:MAG: response regulator [Sporichthyaceae bacterium]
MTMTPTGPPVKILMVDDRPENLLALEAILSGLGHELIRAECGSDALKQLLLNDIALILLDVQMPGMDGFETATQIKARERTQDIPIVFLTAIDDGAHQAFRGYSAGAVDYLCKPFDPWVLRAKVNVFIELHQRRRELQALRERFDSERLAVLGAVALDAARRAAATARVSGSPESAQAMERAVEAVAELLEALPPPTATLQGARSERWS